MQESKYPTHYCLITHPTVDYHIVGRWLCYWREYLIQDMHPVPYNDGALDITPEGLTTLQLRKKIMILMVSSSADRCSDLHI